MSPEDANVIQGCQHVWISKVVGIDAITNTFFFCFTNIRQKYCYQTCLCFCFFLLFYFYKHKQILLPNTFYFLLL